MTKRTFLAADLHVGHPGVCRFLKADGVTKLRPWDNTTDMDDALVEAWNDTVSPTDKVYVLGDVALNKKELSTIARLNGDKVLIKGNHDVYKLSDYMPYFRDVRGCHVLDGYILTHVPIHPDCLEGRWKGNIHGHLHDRRIMLDGEPDPRYLCVSMEQIDFRPILLEEALRLIGAPEREASCQRYA